MKRVFTIAIALLLVLVVSDVSFSREQPYNYKDPSRGDDHTWGGEQRWDGSIDLAPGSGGFVPVGSSFTHLDLLINIVFGDWFYGDSWNRSMNRKTHFYIIPNGGNQEEDSNPTDNNKGNTR
ncbi:MAG: hypothetical protein ABII79_13775 [bacterium]